MPSLPLHALELARLRDAVIDLETERADLENALLDGLASLAQNRRRMERALTQIVVTLDGLLQEFEP